MGGIGQRCIQIACGVALLSLSGCIVPVKVREKWQVREAAVIPLREITPVWRQLSNGQTPDPAGLELYNESVALAVEQVARNWVTDSDSLSAIETSNGPATLRVDARGVSGIKRFDELVPAGCIRVKSGFDTDTEVEGVGEALMVKQEWSEEDPMIPRTGVWYPVTGLLDLDVPSSPVLRLYDPTDEGEVAFAGRRFPLSADYTATFARDFQERQFQFNKIPALLRFDQFADRLGLYRISSLNPRKKVCILVHGVNSSPNTWNEGLNRIYEDRQVREGYEFWTFGYPSGAPIPFLAAKLRESIEEMLAFRAANGATNQEVTLLTHSMGGILAKAVTQHGGDEDWNLLFRVPIEELKVKPEDRETLRRMVYYEPIDEVKRVIFCAVPHQGSNFATRPHTQMIGGLIEMPQQLAQLTKDLVQQSSYALTPVGMEIAKYRFNSLEQLKPGSQVTSAYLNEPLNSKVSFHSIIARKDNNPAKPLEESTDGFVTYRSAHLDGVDSEKVILNSPHGVHRTEDGVREIVRILRLP